MIRESFLVFVFGVATLVAGLYVVQEECADNEEYLLCGSACPFNCSNPEGPANCSDDCIEGCFCKAGYLRDLNGSCVTADQCFGESNPICEDNEEFLYCGTACPLTCSNPEQPACGLACSVGCFCKDGYVRDEGTNKCVTVDQCPKEQCFSQNEVYDICNAACEPSCEDPLPVCTSICKGGCVCAANYLRGVGGECVTWDKCNSTKTDAGLLGKYYDVINKILHLSTA